MGEITINKKDAVEHYIWKKKNNNFIHVKKYTYKRLIIVSTTIAEASITIETLNFVIDMGYFNFVSHNPTSNQQISKIVEISENSRIQRRGRLIGRAKEGAVFYLYTENRKINNKWLLGMQTDDIQKIILSFFELFENVVLKKFNEMVLHFKKNNEINGEYSFIFYNQLLKSNNIENDFIYYNSNNKYELDNFINYDYKKITNEKEFYIVNPNTDDVNVIKIYVNNLFFSYNLFKIISPNYFNFEYEYKLSFISQLLLILTIKFEKHKSNKYYYKLLNLVYIKYIL